MRISDWSSDVCSSDLEEPGWRPPASQCPNRSSPKIRGSPDWAGSPIARPCGMAAAPGALCPTRPFQDGQAIPGHYTRRCYRSRSEENTSELQSLMRISYAVFCLKQKNNYKNPIYNH